MPPGDSELYNQSCPCYVSDIMDLLPFIVIFKLLFLSHQSGEQAIISTGVSASGSGSATGSFGDSPISLSANAYVNGGAQATNQGGKRKQLITVDHYFGVGWWWLIFLILSHNLYSCLISKDVIANSFPLNVAMFISWTGSDNYSIFAIE